MDRTWFLVVGGVEPPGCATAKLRFVAEGKQCDGLLAAVGRLEQRWTMGTPRGPINIRVRRGAGDVLAGWMNVMGFGR